MSDDPDLDAADSEGDEDVQGHLRLTDDQLSAGTTPGEALAAAREAAAEPDATRD